jgi:hypothetical protein
MLKLESKDPLLTQAWYNIEFIPVSLACLESVIYDHVDWSVLLSFSYSDFALLLFYRCVRSLPLNVSRSRSRHL